MDEKTLDILRDAVRLSPDNAALRAHLAQGLQSAGQFEEARELWLALAGDAEDAAPLLALGEIALSQNRAEEAAAKLSEAIARDGENARAHWLLARAQKQLGQNEKAARTYRRAIELDPELRDPEFSRSLEDEPQPIRLSNDSSDWNDEDDDSDLSRIGLELERPKISFAEIGGMEELKEEIRINIIHPFKQPELYAAYGKKIGGGILLYGPPGCGKTYIARATAGEVEASFIAVGIEDVLDMYSGQSERKLHLVFEAARGHSPTVIFFDELDAMAGKRSDMTHSPHARSLVNQFLAEMDGAKGDNANLLVVGATNSPWHVDAAFRRPGRFDKIIFVPPPDLVARIEILKLHCANKPVENIEWEKIASRMKRFSGADVAATCDAAAEIGLRESLKTGKLRKLNTNDFLNALKTLRPTTEEWLATAKNYATYANQTGLYDAVSQYLARASDKRSEL